MKKRFRIIIPLLLLLFGGAFAYNTLNHRNDTPSLRFSGNIEVTESRMSFRIPGRLEERLVQEGDSIVAGQRLARLENTDQNIALAQATANLAYTEAVLAELEAGSRKEDIDQAEFTPKTVQAFEELQKNPDVKEISEIKGDSCHDKNNRDGEKADKTMVG